MPKSGKRRRWATWILVTLVGLLGVWTVASYLMVAGIETAPYRVVAEEAGFEVREYPSLVVAETTAGAPGSQSDGAAFRRLAGYIFGGNASERNIAMTAPVLIDDTSGKTRMAFVLPKDIQVAAAPKPNNGDVGVRTTEPRMMAAKRFSWFAPRSRRAAIARQLQSEASSAGYKLIGPPIYAAYNPPFSIPFMKRHEILVPVGSGRGSKPKT